MGCFPFDFWFLDYPKQKRLACVGDSFNIEHLISRPRTQREKILKDFVGYFILCHFQAYIVPFPSSLQELGKL